MTAGQQTPPATTTRRVLLGMGAVIALIGALVIAVATSGTGADRLPSGPVAAVQDDRLPTVPLAQIPQRLDLLSELGVTASRFDIFWSDLATTRPANPTDPADPAYDWRRADATVTGLVQRNITPIVSVYNTPRWASDQAPPRPAHRVNGAAPHPERFGEVMAAIARRYDGTYTPPGHAAPLPQVARMELWNEPNLSRFLHPQTRGGRRVAVDHYAQMVHVAYATIKGINPSATVIVGAGGPTGSNGRTRTSAMALLRGLRAHGVPMDAYSQHISPAADPRHPTTALPSWSSVGAFLRELDQIRPNIPLYITEAGYTTAPTEARRRHVSEAQQAAFLTQIFALPQLQNHRLQSVVWFNLQDTRTWPAGLLRQDGTPKPSHAAMAQVIAEQDGARLR